MKALYTIEDGVPGVRLATADDEAQLFALLLQMHGEMGFFGVNPAKVVEGIKVATERRGGIIYVIEDKRRVVATLGMVFAMDWYSDDEYLSERWNFVHPDYRQGTDYARRLLEQAKWTHERFKLGGRNIPISVGINSFTRTEAKIRMYSRHMPCVGAYFIYGALPRAAMNDKSRAEAAKIAEMNREVSHRKRDRSDTRPAVKEIIRASRGAWG